MARNTKEISLIQHRTGKLSEMPKALNQSEIGVASDTNRLFIGNSKNTILANRTEFPYQNLEILTECSNLGDYFKYTYKNNIDAVGDITNRINLEEIIPIIIECTKSINDSDVEYLSNSSTNIIINNITSSTIHISGCHTVDDLITVINGESQYTQTYVSLINSKLVFISTANELTIDTTSTCEEIIGLPITTAAANDLPERNIVEKLDDVLYITDFGVKQYKVINDEGTETSEKIDNSELIYKSLIEVYNRQNDNQYYRKVFFPAGTYYFESSYPFPLISNLYVYGEGIDRTIIKANETVSNFVLLDSVNINNSIKNIIIEDMTFDSSSDVISKIINASNITFNRVKFKGDTNTLIEIFGKENEDPYVSGEYASNITFNECEFEGGDTGIFIKYLVKNINITNCKFINVNVNGIKIGDGSDNLCKGININGNIFDNTPTKNPGDARLYYGIYLNNNSSYVISHQNQFDEELFENCFNGVLPQPYYINENSEYNFVETPNTKTDGRKILGVNFSQPCWKHLNYLTNKDGEMVLVVDGLDSDIDSNAGLNIINNQDGLEIKVVGENDDFNHLTFTIKNNSDIILGNPLDSNLPVSGNIKLKKTLDLNDNKISNVNGSNDIVIETVPEKLISINETGQEKYNNLIQIRDNEENPLTPVDDIIPNVAYVKNASKYVFEKIIDYKDVEYGKIKLINFDKKIYGNNVHLSRIFVSARIPFYKTFENKNNAVEYKAPELPPNPDPYDIPINRYYAGDVVWNNDSGLTKYAVILKTHDIEYSDIIDFSSTNENIHIINDFDETYKSVKYINICVENDTGYSLTNTYVEDYSKPYEFNKENNIKMLDIQYTNKYGYDNCQNYSNGYDNSVNFDISGDLVTPVVVNYSDVNYALTYNGVYSSVIELHDIDKAYRKYDEGLIYSSELDKNYIFDFSNEEIRENELSMNVAGEDISILLFDENGSQFVYDDPDNLGLPVYHEGSLNPAGKLLVRIEFTKDEV